MTKVLSSIHRNLAIISILFLSVIRNISVSPVVFWTLLLVLSLINEIHFCYRFMLHLYKSYVLKFLMKKLPCRKMVYGTFFICSSMHLNPFKDWNHHHNQDTEHPETLPVTSLQFFTLCVFVLVVKKEKRKKSTSNSSIFKCTVQ